MKINHFSLLCLMSVLLATGAGAAEGPTGYENKNEKEIFQKINQEFSSSAVEELCRRDYPKYKTELVDLARDFSRQKVAPWLNKAVDDNDRYQEELLDRQVRDEAKICLAKHGEEKYLNEFGVRISTTLPKVRYESIDALGRIGNKKAILYLMRHIDDEFQWRVSGGYGMRIDEYAMSVIEWLVRPEVILPPCPKVRALTEAADYKLAAECFNQREKNRTAVRAPYKKWWAENRKKIEKMKYEEAWALPAEEQK